MAKHSNGAKNGVSPIMGLGTGTSNADIVLPQGGAYNLFGPGDVVVSNDSVTAPMWSNNDPTLTVFYTSSTQVSSNVQEYYTSVYQTASTEVSAEIQFDIAYGDQVGSGSQFLNNLVTGSSPTRTNYGQYRNLVLGDENAAFIFAGITSSYWYAMPIERARYKQAILPGTWTMALQGYNSEIVQTAIITNLVQAAPFPTVNLNATVTVTNGFITWHNADGTAVDLTAANPNVPTFTGDVTVVSTTADGVTSLTFIAGSGTAAATNIRAGMLIKFGSGMAGIASDIYVRVNENWMGGTSVSIDATSILSLTDNSKISTTTQFCDAGRIYQIISGSAGVLGGNLKNVNGYTTASGSYGYLLPDINTLLLNGEAIDSIPQAGGINFGTSRSFDSKGENALSLVNALRRAGDPVQGNTGFTINSKEDLSSDYMFCRARNSEFNYSANPSFISSSTGAVLFPSFIENPTTYITTVGLYNYSQQLIAVAKLSRPLEKNFTKELLVRVKLDF